MEQIEEESIRLDKLASDHNWSTSRNLENYILSTRRHTFGLRNFFSITKKKYQLYRDLQNSRGVNIGVGVDVNQRIEMVKKQCFAFPRTKADSERSEELNNQLDFGKLESFFEIGFREPALLEYYETTHNLKSKGCDVNNISVLIGQYLGYDVCAYDLNFKLYPDSRKPEEGGEIYSDDLRTMSALTDALSACDAMECAEMSKPDDLHSEKMKGFTKSCKESYRYMAYYYFDNY